MLNKDKLCKLCGLNKRNRPAVQICEECKNKSIAEKEARTKLKPSREEVFERRRQGRKEQKKRYKQRHKDKVLAEKRRYRQKHRDKILEKNHQYYGRNKEKIVKKINEWREANKGRVLEYRKIWKKTPQGRFSKKVGKFRRRKKESQVIHSFTKEQWGTKVQSANGICPICKQSFDNGLHMLTLDHTPPISKAPIGFVYTIENVSPMCASCNSKKRDTL